MKRDELCMKTNDIITDFNCFYHDKRQL